MVPEEAVAGSHQKTPASGEPPFWNILLPILSFIGTGIGIIGFVIFFGGFIVWSRFDAVGLPANEAVAQVPRNNLIATGASFLVPALLAALAAVTVAAVAWDALIGNRRRARIARARSQQAEAAAQVEKLQTRAARVAHEVDDFRKEMDRHHEGGKQAELGSQDRERARTEYDEAEGEYKQRNHELASLQEKGIPAAQEAEASAKAAKIQAPQPNRAERLLQVAIGGIPMLFAEALVIGAGSSGLEWEQLLVLFGVALATLGVSIVVVNLTGHFAWYALSVFVGVGLVIAFSTYERTHSSTKVSPVAAVQRARPVTGFFVAETTDAVYMARAKRTSTKQLQFDHDGVTLERLPKKSVTDLTVGPLMGEARAYRRSLEVALGLCRRQKETTTIATPAGAGTAASRTRPNRGRSRHLACARSEIRGLRKILAQL